MQRINIPSVNSLLDLSGKIAVITGSGYGIGQGIASRLSEAGASIVVHFYSHQRNAEKLASQVRNTGGNAIILQADLTKRVEVTSLFNQTTSHFGKIDILINNAGIYPVSHTLETSEEEWDTVLDTNLKTIYLCTQEAGKIMKNQGGGVIINISSIESIFPANMHAHYCASKAGVNQYTKSTARELAPYGIRVNAVSPGLIWKEGIEESWPEGVTRWLDSVPLKRIGHSADVADACLFLASPAARWITGINLIVDGGASTRPAF
jgi:NAD(P)-dependent dehydrogenase (short-subunit alcohol dehydrogenase family)